MTPTRQANLKSPTAEILGPEIQELIDGRRFRDLRAALEVLEPGDIAETLESLEPGDAAVAFRLLPRGLAGESLANLEQYTQEDPIGARGK